jgi:pimeloyl-ACP methyl ester carboxylesterase
MQRHLSLLALPFAASLYFAGCLSDSDGDGAFTPGTGGSAGAPTSGSGGSGGAASPDPSQNEANKDAAPNYVTYLDNLSTHPGCTKVGLDTRLGLGEAAGSGRGAYVAADIPNYPCAAKAYDATNVDPAKPIIILVHGNSSTPLDYDSFLAPTAPGAVVPQLSERLVAAGFRVYSADFRYDKVSDPADQMTGNPAKNFDHGWATPILQSLVGAVLQQFPDNKVSLVGFSLGATIIRDSLRRMHRAKLAPFARVQDLVLVAGANHGVSTFVGLCGDVNNPTNKTMRGAAACQLGDRGGYVPVPFLIPLNGPAGAFETPCIDGINAYGQAGVCGNNSVQYTTLVKEDPENGPLQDEFVSEASAALTGATNLTSPEKDSSGYFFTDVTLGTTMWSGSYAAFDDHYGALRSEAALTAIVTALSN